MKNISILPIIIISLNFSCASKKNRSIISSSSVTNLNEQNQNFQTTLGDHQFNLTTFTTSEDETTILSKKMRNEVYKYAIHHGESAGGSFIMSDVELGMIYAYIACCNKNRTHV